MENLTSYGVYVTFADGGDGCVVAEKKMLKQFSKLAEGGLKWKGSLGHDLSLP